MQTAFGKPESGRQYLDLQTDDTLWTMLLQSRGKVDSIILAYGNQDENIHQGIKVFILRICNLEKLLHWRLTFVYNEQFCYCINNLIAFKKVIYIKGTICYLARFSHEKFKWFQLPVSKERYCWWLWALSALKMSTSAPDLGCHGFYYKQASHFLTFVSPRIWICRQYWHLDTLSRKQDMFLHVQKKHW